VEDSFRPHSGWEVKTLPHSEMEEISAQSRDLPEGSVLEGTTGYFNIGTEEKPVEQKFLFLHERARPTTVAHEVGHLALHHCEEDVKSARGYLRHELGAWKWASDKIPITYEGISEVALNYMELTNSSSKRTVSEVRRVFQELDWTLDPGYFDFLQEYLEAQREL